MLKKIKRETDIITNVDLFNEIVLRVKESESCALVNIFWTQNYKNYSVTA